MANNDDTQAKMTTDNTNPADSFVANSAPSAATSLANESNSTVNKIIQKDEPLMRYFDLAEEANYSYVLGYN